MPSEEQLVPFLTTLVCHGLGSNLRPPVPPEWTLYQLGQVTYSWWLKFRMHEILMLFLHTKMFCDNVEFNINISKQKVFANTSEHTVDISWKSIKQLPHDKTNKMTVRQEKTQISLGIHLVWSESLLYVQWVAKDPSFLYADSKDTDQTAQSDLSFWWAHRSLCWFCHEVAQKLYTIMILFQQAGLEKPCHLFTILSAFFGWNEPRHEKTCLMPYANNKDADQPDQCLCRLLPW